MREHHDSGGKAEIETGWLLTRTVEIRCGEVEDNDGDVASRTLMNVQNLDRQTHRNAAQRIRDSRATTERREAADNETR